MENINPINEDLTPLIQQALKKVFDENQKKPFQYVVAYKRKDNEELIGYHADSFCQTTQDILQAKRYNGEDPYGQLEIIWKNIVSTLNTTEEDTKKEGISGVFAKLSYSIKQNDFKGLSKDDIYIDAVYLTDGIEPQRFVSKVIIPNSTSDGQVSNT